MTCDEDLVLLLQFAFNRFSGVVPEEKMLMNCVRDWRQEAFGPTPAERKRNLKLRAKSLALNRKESLGNVEAKMPKVAV